MKLLNRAILYFSLAFLVSLLIAGAVLYTSIRHIVLKQVSEALLTEKTIIREQLEQLDSVPDFTEVFNHKIEVTLFEHKIKTSQAFVDSLLPDPAGDGMLKYRFLIYRGNTESGRGYVIRTSQSIEEEEGLLYEILGIIVISFAILTFILILVMYSVSRRLWDSFYRTLASIRQFDVRTRNRFSPAPTTITEFTQLNSVLKALTDKISSEYLNLKEFSENASHEIQTPLAVIRTGVEQMLQSPGINDELTAHLTAISQSVNRISRINQALTLLSKIENSQYPDTETLSFNSKIAEVLNLYRDYMEARQIGSRFEPAEEVELRMHPDLADLLLNNLIGNAVRHNVNQGWISIRLTRRELILENSGNDPGMDTDLLFQRFRKAEQSGDSPGLGLALVKKITDLYNMEVAYRYADGVHILSVKFC